MNPECSAGGRRAAMPAPPPLSWKSIPASRRNVHAFDRAPWARSAPVVTAAARVGIHDPERPPLAQRLRQRPAVDVLELAADRHAAREAAHLEAAGGQQLADVMRGRLALVGEVGREHDLLHHAVGRALDAGAPAGSPSGRCRRAATAAPSARNRGRSTPASARPSAGRPASRRRRAATHRACRTGKARKRRPR